MVEFITALIPEFSLTGFFVIYTGSAALGYVLLTGPVGSRP